MTLRRGFLRRVGSAAALGLAGLMPRALHAQPAPPRSDGPNWPGLLKGRHRQVVDAYEVNSGFPLAFAYTFLAPNESATAVIILRHGAFPIALGDAMWAKYKVGETFKIIDPETKAPAVKNPFFHPKPGVLIVDDMALDRLLAKGAVVGGCNVALRRLGSALILFPAFSAMGPAVSDLKLLAVTRELRDRAKEALAKAETFHDPEAKRLMRQIGATHEELAQRLEREASAADKT